MEPLTYKQALRELVDRKFIQLPRYGEQQFRADRAQCHPKLFEWEKAFVKRLKAMGVPVFAHCVWRNRDEQDRLFAEGRSKARAGESPHNYGLAVDIIHGTRAWELSRKAWAVLGHVGKEVALQRGIKLTWGGDWAFYDPAHWEIADWKALKDPASWPESATGLY